MEDAIVIIVLILLLGWAFRYIRKNRSKGVKCIGCPYASSCGQKACCSSQTKAVKKPISTELP